ncbi:hypothetical protein BGZ79_010786 [Entomortierella chlamydospora]|nr:hypothetical protein BGZ79_010786 [Entomortierella chlamydospora]
MISLSGTLSVYNPQTRLTMFESGPENSTASVVFIGGLLDGYHALPYLPLLDKTLAEQVGMSLIQVMLSSSHMGYGISSLQEDVKELDVLFDFLLEKRAKTRLFIVGHSTGCQDAISYACYGKHKEAIQGIVLQGPVSDREFMASSMDIGDDDMFSSDIPFEKMQELFGQVKSPLIMVHSAKDEYIPEHINKDKLISQLAAACPTCVGAIVLSDADHAISDQASQATFCDAVVQFLTQVVAHSPDIKISGDFQERMADVRQKL